MELLRPSSAEEASRALGNGSRALAGGTELVPLMRDGLVKGKRWYSLTADYAFGHDLLKAAKVFFDRPSSSHRASMKVSILDSLAELMSATIANVRLSLQAGMTLSLSLRA